MKRILVATLALVALPVALSAQQPQADSGAMVVEGNARFTVLTSRLVRMEWSADGRFEDRATLGVVNRELPVPAYTVRHRGRRLILKTADLELTYTPSGRFDAANLSVQFRMNGKKVAWNPSLEPSGNLLGTTRTLDRCDGETTQDPFDLGVVSRDGWAVLDESVRHVFQPVDTDWENWVEARPEGDRQDLYLFAYGHDYKAAVSDFTRIAGRIPLPPKYAFGYWWCRYWQYSDAELVDLARHFKSFDIPADVMIIDMDWHETWSPEEYPGYVNESGVSRLGWTGYTWKKEFFPAPESLMRTLHGMHIKTSLNLHPASGIQVFEEPYERFVADYLSRTSDYDGPEGYRKPDGTATWVPYRMDQQEWADAYFNSVIHPFERQGIDFWWLDWQQFRESKYVPGLSNTFWINYAFFQDKVRQSASLGPKAERPIIYHRWGGIGSHRYQVGFSGDTYATWKVLGYLPYFTATASNVGYGYWGHDIGGHMQPKGVQETDPELYTRWLQGGVFTPIFKTHSTKDRTMEKRFWMFPEHFDAMRDAIRLRYTLSPYIYGAARQAYDTGISLCRPLYYEYPEVPEAYDRTQEFFFGDDILATAVCEPADPATGLAGRTMWFPGGTDWYDMATGTLYPGGTEATLHYTMAENPYFVRAGAVIPMAALTIGSLQEPSDELWLFVAPGDGASSTTVYEDDGVSQAYATDFATTLVEKESDARLFRLKVGAREGSYDGMSPDRVLRVVVEGVLPPSSVSVDGREIPYARFPEEASGPVWTYDGNAFATVVYLPSAAADRAVMVACTYDEEAAASRDLVNGRKGLVRRMTALMPEAKYLFNQYLKGDIQLPKAMLNVAQCGGCITERPSDAVTLLRSLDVDAVNAALARYEKLPADFRQKVAAQAR